MLPSVSKHIKKQKTKMLSYDKDTPGRYLFCIKANRESCLIGGQKRVTFRQSESGHINKYMARKGITCPNLRIKNCTQCKPHLC